MENLSDTLYAGFALGLLHLEVFVVGEPGFVRKDPGSGRTRVVSEMSGNE